MKTSVDVNSDDCDKSHGILFVCHECDALQHVAQIKPGRVARCVSCGGKLFRNPKGGIEKPLALALSSLMLFIIANLYPIMTIKIAGIERSTTLTGAAWVFLEQGNYDLAAVVWFPSVFIPGFILSGLLYVLMSVRFNLSWPYTRQTLAWVSRLLPWGMLDVFLLGVLVALVKLVALADVVLGIGIFSMLMVIFLYAATIAAFEPHLLWECLSQKKRYRGLND